MRTTYVDTSAAMKLVVAEPESDALASTLSDGHRLVASWLLHTELHRAAGRHPDDVDLRTVRAVLDALHLVDLTRGDMISAGTHRPLRSHDALHLAAAMRLGVDAVATYDAEMAAATTAAGLLVLAPVP